MIEFFASLFNVDIVRRSNVFFFNHLISVTESKKSLTPVCQTLYAVEHVALVS